jgi:hypothetical protein
MDSRDSFADRRKAQEEEYFHRKEKELLEKARQRAALAAKREELSNAVGVADDDIIADLQELGYEREIVRVLHLVPLVQVAWAEGKVSSSERELILEAARLRGVTKDSPAYAQFTSWIDTRPTDAFFDKTLRVIAALINHLPAEDGEARKRELLDYSAKIAEASGSLLSAVGLASKVTDEERAVLERISKALE